MVFDQSQQKYAFILGHCPELSRAEIIRTLEHWSTGALEHDNFNFRPVFYNRQVFIIETDDQLMVNELQERLGGTIKISRITHHVSNKEMIGIISQIIIKRLKDLKINNQRFQFGFSAYGGANIKELQRIGLKIKKELKEEGVASRFIVSKEPGLSSVIIHKERLIDSGVDLVIIQADGQFYLGYTQSVQKFEDYSRRDYGRPYRDDKSGMLPPKVAKIMLNLSQADFKQTILDSFCGSGTIIQEALLLGYQNIIGSDIAEKAVKDSQNNIKWLETKYRLDVSGVKIFQSDAGNLLKKLPLESIDSIVTEPYLGPARAIFKSQFPISKQTQNSKSQTQNILSELSTLYLQAFAEFNKVLKRSGKIVIIFPIIDGQRLAILDKIKDRRLRIEELSEEPRGSIVYFRPGQRVAREIFVFTKG